MPWTTLTLRVTTPLFNGGADPADDAGLRPTADAGVRVASVRGAMRFWFRALAGTVAGPDLRLLAELERRVFGDAGTASAVQVRIPAQPRITRTRMPDFLTGDMGPWLTYLLGQGLTKYDRDKRRFELTRPYVDAGQMFDLRLRFTNDDAGALALAALRLCSLYGGLGARVRRGFGGMRIVGVDGPVPAPWTEAALRGNGLRDYDGIGAIEPTGQLAACHEVLSGMRDGVLAGPDVWNGTTFDGRWAGPPKYPVLSPVWSVAGLSGGDPFEVWEHVLWEAGYQLRYFRAGDDNKSPRARYSPKIETPEWLGVIHGQDDRFPVGALGLPVVYKDGFTVNADRGQEKLRRASPLWLRAVGSEDEWRLLSFAFLGEFLPGPDAPEVHLWRHGTRGRPLQVTDADVKRQMAQWIRVMREDKTFVPRHHQDKPFRPFERRQAGELNR